MLRKKYNIFSHKKKQTAIIFVVLAIYGFVPSAFAMMNSSDNSSLSGPYEIVVKMGLEGDGLILPLEVSDQNKPEKLNIAFSVPETALKINLEEYIPDLVWETTAVEYEGNGIAAKLKINGKETGCRYIAALVRQGYPRE